MIVSLSLRLSLFRSLPLPLCLYRIPTAIQCVRTSSTFAAAYWLHRCAGAVGWCGCWQRFCAMVLHALLLVRRGHKRRISNEKPFSFLHCGNLPTCALGLTRTHAYMESGSFGSIGLPSDGFDYTCLFGCDAQCFERPQNIKILELNRVSVRSMLDAFP